jgi:hypothetical protein
MGNSSSNNYNFLVELPPDYQSIVSDKLPSYNQFGMVLPDSFSDLEHYSSTDAPPAYDCKYGNFSDKHPVQNNKNFMTLSFCTDLNPNITINNIHITNKKIMCYDSMAYEDDFKELKKEYYVNDTAYCNKIYYNNNFIIGIVHTKNNKNLFCRFWVKDISINSDIFKICVEKNFKDLKSQDVNFKFNIIPGGLSYGLCHNNIKSIYFNRH